MQAWPGRSPYKAGQRPNILLISLVWRPRIWHHVVMDARAFLREITGDVRYRGQIAHVREIPAREAQYAEPAAELDDRLRSMLRRRNIHRLYTHQAAPSTPLPPTRTLSSLPARPAERPSATTCPSRSRCFPTRPGGLSISSRPRPSRRISSACWRTGQVMSR